MRFEPSTGLMRHVRLGDREVLRGIYAAVRDRRWHTVRPEVALVEVERGPDHFRLVLDVETREGDIHFRWRGVLTGSPDGTVRYQMDGSARSSFLRNRIGFCVLHPVEECAGQSCSLQHTDGEWERSRFPLDISPHQPFFDLQAIAHEVEPGVRAELRFEGDVFETEDQRNWTDASFKTYCTPLARPFPAPIREGEVVRQAVTLTLTGAPRSTPGEVERGEVEVRVVDDAVAGLPTIGVGHATHGRPLDAVQVERLRALAPAHLRVELRLGDSDLEGWLREGWATAAAIGVPLEAALYLSGDPEGELARLRRLLDQVAPRVARWLVFHADEPSTTGPWAALVRRVLGDYGGGVPVGAGSNANFTELNRGRPQASELDFVCYPVNPQVHAFDDLSLVETLPVQGETVRNARRFAGTPVVVSPVTLRPRPAPGSDAEGQADPRQGTRVGAAWTLGSIKHLAQAGAASVTYFEATGAGGLMGDEVYPVYHVLADVLESAGARVLRARSGDPLRAEALALRTGRGVRLLACNLSPEAVTLRVTGLGGGRDGRIRVLDARSERLATREPRRFREEGWRALGPGDGELRVELGAHAFACIDLPG
jgi:hypothetical protein